MKHPMPYKTFRAPRHITGRHGKRNDKWSQVKSRRTQPEREPIGWLDRLLIEFKAFWSMPRYPQSRPNVGHKPGLHMRRHNA